MGVEGEEEQAEEDGEIATPALVVAAVPAVVKAADEAAAKDGKSKWSLV